MSKGYLPKELKTVEIDASTDPQSCLELPDDAVIILTSEHVNPVGEIASWIDRFQIAGGKNAVILHAKYGNDSLENIRIKAGADLGAWLLRGYGVGILVSADDLDKDTLAKLELDILQATGLRIYRRNI